MTAWLTRRVWFAGDNWGPITQDAFPLKRYFPADAKLDFDRNADIVFVNESVKSLREFRQLRQPHQVRIFCATEAIAPNFNIFDYALGFDHISFGDRYIRMHPLMLYSDYRAQLERRKGDSRFRSTQAFEGRAFCNFVYSNPNGHPFRAEFFQAYQPTGELIHLVIS